LKRTSSKGDGKGNSAPEATRGDFSNSLGGTQPSLREDHPKKKRIRTINPQNSWRLSSLSKATPREKGHAPQYNSKRRKRGVLSFITTQGGPVRERPCPQKGLGRSPEASSGDSVERGRKAYFFSLGKNHFCRFTGKKLKRRTYSRQHRRQKALLRKVGFHEGGRQEKRGGVKGEEDPLAKREMDFRSKRESFSHPQKGGKEGGRAKWASDGGDQPACRGGDPLYHSLPYSGKGGKS